MTALATAEGLIYGEKAAAYGDPVENFDRLAALWSPILGVEVTAQQVTLCLLQLKVSRLIHQPGHEDSIVDAAGYVGCYERVTKERPVPWCSDRVGCVAEHRIDSPCIPATAPRVDMGDGSFVALVPLTPPE